MERPKLSSDRAELIVNLLRDNPGVNMTLGDISEQTDLPAEDLGAHLDELVDHMLVERESTPDGFDVYRFPAEFQRGTMAP